MSTGSVRPSGPPARDPASVPRSLLCALVVLLVAVGMLVAAPAVAAGRADDAPDQGEAGPLQVTLTGLSPAVVPRRGPLTLTGTVTNTDTEEWRDVNVHAWASGTAITSSDQLAEASRTPYDAEVGTRLTEPRTFAGIGDLAPGDSTDFVLRVPRSQLPIRDQAGVYWIGVQTLGTSADGRDDTADGRARTFVPLVPEGAARRPLPASLVLPVREPVARDAAGRLRDPDRWVRLLGPTGRLGRLLGLAESSRDFPLTLLADPAVLDAADLLARGNDPSASQDASSSQASLARNWLDRLVAVANRDTTVGLGYADPDAASLAARDRGLLGESRRLAQQSFRARGVSGAVPGVAPTDGVLPGSAFSALGDDTRVLLSAKAVEDTDGDDAGSTSGGAAPERTSTGQPLSLVDTGATARGPGPGAVEDALTYRQRILAEGALRLVAGDRSPMVVVPPADWDPGSGWQQAVLLPSLQVPWLRWSGLGQDLGPASGTAGTLDSPAYSSADRRAQVGDRLVRATRSAVGSGDTLASALERPGSTADAYRRLALQGVSYAARGDRDAAFGRVRDLDSAIRGRLGRVRITGSRFVTLSGGSGLFSVSMVNGLDRPVRVGLAATTSNDDLSLRLPSSVVLPARQRTTVRIEATSRQTGVRSVRLSPTAADGTRIGTPLVFNVRDSQVSAAIWAVLAGGVLLVLAMVLRRVRRGRRRDPDDESSPNDPGGPRAPGEPAQAARRAGSAP